MQYTIAIAAGKTEPINCAESTFFAVVLSGLDLLIRIPGQEFQTYGQGDSMTLTEGRTFRRLEVKNTSLSDTVVVIYAGRDRYEQRRQSVIDAPSETAPVATEIAGETTLVLPGTPSGKRIRRRSILVSNPDSALDLQIVDPVTGAVLDTVFFRTSAILNMSGPIGIRNPASTPITASVTEVWWTVS